MAKTSWLERDKRKRETVAKWAELRAELKEKKDYIGLSQLPRNASPVRLTNRCLVSGRRRAFHASPSSEKIFCLLRAYPLGTYLLRL